MPDINTVVVTPQVSVVAVNSSVPGSYDSVARLGLDWLDVTDPIYGAVGDGSTNDTAAIQAALDDATSNAVVFFPPKVFRADGLTFTGTNVTLLLAGATLKARTNATGTRILTLTDCVRCEVVGGLFDGNSLAQVGIRVAEACESVTLRDVKVRNIIQLTGETQNANAIEVKPVGNATPPKYTRILNADIDTVNGAITGVARGIYVGDDGGPSGTVPLYTTILGGCIRNITPVTDGDGIQFDGNGTPPAYGLIEGVTLVETAKRAIKIACTDVVVRNCILQNTTASWANGPISLYASRTSAIGNFIRGPRTGHGIEIGASGALENIVVTNNYIELDSGTAVSAQDGIRVLTALTNFTINGNLIKKCRSGIVLNSATSTLGTIQGNTIADFTSAGIRADVTSPTVLTGCAIVGNAFTTASGGGPTGVWLKDGSLNVIANNTAQTLAGSLVFGLTSDSVALRWGNIGGTATITKNVMTEPAIFRSGIAVNSTAVSSTPTTLDNTYGTILADATSGALTLNLPTAVGRTGLRYTVVKVDATGNTVTLDADGTETINGIGTLALSSQYAKTTIESTGAVWVVVG